MENGGFSFRHYVAAYVPLAAAYLHAVNTATDNGKAERALAKAYLWSSAAVRRGAAVDNGAEAQQLLARVLEIMPAVWVES